jgi:hypothetical protein
LLAIHDTQCTGQNQALRLDESSGAGQLSNRVFEDYDAIIDVGCEAWNKLIAQPENITSIGPYRSV